MEKIFLFILQMRTEGERGTLHWINSHGWKEVVAVSMVVLR